MYACATIRFGMGLLAAGLFLAPAPNAHAQVPAAPAPRRLAVREVRTSSQKDGEAFAPAHLADGQTGAGRGWSSAPAPTAETVAWCAVLMDRAHVVTQINLWAAADDGRGFPAAFEIEYCTDEGRTWYGFPRGRVANAALKPGDRRVAVSFPEVIARGLRIRATRLGADGNGAFALHLAEVEVLGQDHAGPFAVAPDDVQAADLNNFWRIYGLGLHQNGSEPMLGGRRWWGIPVSASDGDWTELKLAWHADARTRRSLRQWLLQIPIDTNGYVWAAADGRKHLNQHTLWHTNADFINALWECWRWDGDPAALTEAPDYSVGVVTEDGALQTSVDATDFAHYIHGDGMSLSQTFHATRPFRAARARIAAGARADYEMRLYAAGTEAPVARGEFKGAEGSANGWTTLECPAVQAPGTYRLEVRNRKGYHAERLAWLGCERDACRGGVSAQNGLTNLSQLERARRAMQYLLDDAGMRGRADGIVTIPDPDHDGTPQPTARRTGGAMPSTYYDLVRSGHRDAWVNVRYLKALDSLARLEEAAGEPARAQACRHQLKRARAAFHQTFWTPGTGRYAGWVDVNGVPWDYGEVGVNLAALLYADPPPEAANLILDWIAGRRIVAGDTSRGADIYFWKFAPRKNTLAYERPGATNHWWGGWFWDFRSDGTGRANFGNQEENGGTNPFLSYYDVLARLRHRGADDAWARFAGGGDSVLGDFHRDHLRRPTPPDPHHPGERFKAYVLDLPEAGLPPLVVLHGFLGVKPDGRALHLHPRLPAGVDRLGVRDIGFRGRVYAIEAARDGTVTLTAGTGEGDALTVVFDGSPAGGSGLLTTAAPDGSPAADAQAVTADAEGRVLHVWKVHEDERLRFTPVPRPPAGAGP